MNRSNPYKNTGELNFQVIPFKKLLVMPMLYLNKSFGRSHKLLSELLLCFTSLLSPRLYLYGARPSPKAHLQVTKSLLNLPNLIQSSQDKATFPEEWDAAQHCQFYQQPPIIGLHQKHANIPDFLSGGLETIALVGIIIGVIVAVGILAGIIIAVVRKMSGRYS